jgi:hypothetical protein
MPSRQPSPPGGIDALAGVDATRLQPEFNQNPNALRAELLQEPIRRRTGFVKLPERPRLAVSSTQQVGRALSRTDEPAIGLKVEEDWDAPIYLDYNATTQ